MSELRVRDHSQPCDCESWINEADGNEVGPVMFWEPHWECTNDACPGGKEIVLREVESFTVFPDQLIEVEGGRLYVVLEVVEE